MKKIHYYHVFAAGPWQLILNQHFMALCNYGLAEELDEIRVGIVGPPNARKAVKETIAASLIADKTKIVIERGVAWEQATLTELWKAAQGEDAAYFYAHTKGAYDRSIQKQLWCRSMLFFNIVAYGACLEKLQEADAVGCHWITKEEFPYMVCDTNKDGIPYFAGNFWWSKSGHVRELPEPSRNHRYEAEFWIGSRPKMKIKDLNPGWPDVNKFMITF